MAFQSVGKKRDRSCADNANTEAYQATWLVTAEAKKKVQLSLMIEMARPAQSRTIADTTVTVQNRPNLERSLHAMLALACLPGFDCEVCSPIGGCGAVVILHCSIRWA